MKNNSLEKKQMDIFKDCNIFLFEESKNSENNYGKNNNITKLFCIAYIKVYCYTFIKMNGDIPSFYPLDIIKEINKMGNFK